MPETTSLKRGSLAYGSFSAGAQRIRTAANIGNRCSQGGSAPTSRGGSFKACACATEAANRPTLDLGAQRIELASEASEVEREWLARLLAHRHALAQVLGNGGTMEG
jgi:hypothetical protein